MKLFSNHFAEHIIPRLQNLIRAEAVCVARHVEDYGGAFAAVMAYANRYGASHLPDEIHADLEDWVSSELAEQIMRAEERDSSSFLQYVDRLMLPAVAYA